tara:strand:+ start:996 stop:1901 length:906 start_codon:yes stop_codon:yes gene_type:complete
MMIQIILKGLKVVSGGLFCLFMTFSATGQTWVTAGTDAAGDAQASGLDALKLEYAYDKSTDKIMLRVTVSDLLPFAASPSADFSFFFPDGVDGGEPTGTHWTAPAVPVHKTITMYADKSGSAPSNYTWTSFPRTIALAGGSKKVLCSGCISIETKTAQNQLIYTLDRKSLITDAELGSDKKVTLTVVANVGHDIGWDDNLTKNGSMTIDVSTDQNVGIKQSTQPQQYHSVYPNPNHGYVTVNSNESETIELYSVQGAKLMEWNKNQGEQVFDLTQYETGVYFLRASSSNGDLLWTQKITIN